MKSSLVFLNVEGIGLNPKWKGNYLKLVNKPNLNNLISGIYPWSIISNNEEEKEKKFDKKKLTVSKDLEKNFIQTLLGDNNQLSAFQKFEKAYEEKTLLDLPIWDKIKKHCDKHQSCAHLFFLLSSNKIHITTTHLKLIINFLLKKNIKIVLHIISDGKDCVPFSFSNEIGNFFRFLSKRKIPIASIAGRDHVFIKEGYPANYSAHIQDYFSHIIGLGKNSFESPVNYANENLFASIDDSRIQPAINRNIYKNFIEEEDSVIFLDYDSDVFSSLLWLLVNKKTGYFKHLQVCSLNNVYNNFNCKIENFFDPLKIENSIPNLVSKNNLNTLILSFAHKKGFIEKYYGNKKDKNPLIKREVILLPEFNNDNEYIFSANKILVDKVIKEVGKYDLIIVHNPVIAEVAKKNNLNLTKFAFETFDKNLGRLLNFIESTGNVLSLLANYGAIEKLVNKKFYSTPYNKKSPTFFIFSNGEVDSNQLVSSFYSVYSTILSSLKINNEDQVAKPLITRNYSKFDIAERNKIDFDIWKKEFALPLIKNFEENKLSLYDDFEKNSKYLSEKQNYIILKEILKIQENISLTREARKRVYDFLFEYLNFNKIDFENFKYNIYKIISDIYSNKSKTDFKKQPLYGKFFEHNIWIKKIKKTDFWVKKVKVELNPIVKREKLNKNYGNVINVVNKFYSPFSFFEKFFISEKKVLESNSAIEIAKFYDSTKFALTSIYNEYFLDKINNYLAEIEDEESETTAMPPLLYKISQYYDIFQIIIKTIEENKDNLFLYDQKFVEKLPYINAKKMAIKNYSVFKANLNEVNYLLKLILPIYKSWEMEINLFANQILSNDKFNMNSYDMKYARKINEEESKATYENEFIDGVDLKIQKRLKLKLAKKAKETNSFYNLELVDNSKIEDGLSLNIDEHEADDIPDRVRIQRDYNLLDNWHKKRLEDNKISSYLSVDPFVVVEKQIGYNKALSDASQKISSYMNKSIEWRTNLKKEDYSITKEN